MKKHYASAYENKSNFLIGLFAVALIYLFYHVLVAFVYEATESLAALNADEAIGAGEGNKIRQLIYVLMITACAAFFFKKQNFIIKRFYWRSLYDIARQLYRQYFQAHGQLIHQYRYDARC